MMNDIQEAVHKISRSKNTAALTGAGISVESGIPPFRGKGGVWERIDPDVAHIDTFMRDPAMVWQVLIKEMKDIIDKAAPNDAHFGLAKLEQLGKLSTIITQNVDGLHQLAGNKDVIEFHGNFAWQRCMICDSKCETRQIKMDVIPPKCQCGGIYRPDCVFFGEMIPHDALIRSEIAASHCEVMLVIGTSAVVQPAAFMPSIAKQHGAAIIEINMERTQLTDSVTDIFIKGSASRIMTDIVSEIEKSYR